MAPSLFSENCSGFNVNSWTGSVLSGSVPTSATTDYVYKMMLLVSKAVTEYGQRSSQAEIIISISPADAPTVSVQYITPKRMNPSSALKLVGVVRSVKTTSVNCSWGVDDTSVDLSAVASTPVAFKVSATNALIGTLIGTSMLNFALVPFSLRERSTFTFTLSCLSESSVLVARSSLVVTTNGQPLPGEFIVVPDTGTALNTSFMFLSSKWFDEDLPLSYHFGFVSSSSLVTLQSRSEISYGNSILPVGDAASNFILQVFAQIFDVMSAQSTAYRLVTVKNTVISTSFLSNMIFATLNVDNTKKIIGISSSILNSVDCSKSPDCTALNRSPCKDVANTCGLCVSSEWMSGESSDTANSSCIRRYSSQSTTSNSAGASPVDPIKCSDTADCKGWKQCVLGLCQIVEKTCPGDCSGHGKCTFYDIQSSVNVKSCNLGDFSCDIRCDCDTNPVKYSGLTCSKSYQDWKESQALRGQLLLGLQERGKEYCR